MILTGILRSPKNRLFLLVMFYVFLLALVFYSIPPEHDYLNEQLSSEEFAVISGNWEVTEFLGEGVLFHEERFATETEKEESSKIGAQIRSKYQDKRINIEKTNLIAFCPPSEMGYYFHDWRDLFSVYRQPPDIWDGLSLPLLCASFNLKDFDESLDIILDCDNGEAILAVRGQFFKLERIE